MRLPHPWPAVIVALVATNLVTAAALVLWSEGRTAEVARWSANRQKMADLHDLVLGLLGLAERLEIGLNDTGPSGSERGDAIATATGPASAILGSAADLGEAYREAPPSVRTLWPGVEDLGRMGQFFAAIAREVSETGTMSEYHRTVLENVTRIASGLAAIFYPAASGFDATSPLAGFSQDPLANLATADVTEVRALTDQSTCLYEQVYFGGALGPCT